MLAERSRHVLSVRAEDGCPEGACSAGAVTGGSRTATAGGTGHAREPSQRMERTGRPSVRCRRGDTGSRRFANHRRHSASAPAMNSAGSHSSRRRRRLGVSWAAAMTRTRIARSPPCHPTRHDSGRYLLSGRTASRRGESSDARARFGQSGPMPLQGLKAAIDEDWTGRG